MKTALVTGATGNLGQAIVKKFIAGGYKVIGTVIPNDTVKMEYLDDSFDTATVNLASEDDAHKLVNSVISKYETISAAILTVGGFASGNIAATKTSDIAKQYQLNFETAYNIARPVFVQMMQQGQGRIFLIGSKPGLDAASGKGLVAYSLAKSLIFRLAELMNNEAKGTNVVTSVVVPSTIDTPQNRESMPQADFSSWVKAEAIADVIYFYCGDEAMILRQPVIKVYNNA